MSAYKQKNEGLHSTSFLKEYTSTKQLESPYPYLPEVYKKLKTDSSQQSLRMDTQRNKTNERLSISFNKILTTNNTDVQKTERSLDLLPSFRESSSRNQTNESVNKHKSRINKLNLLKI